MSSLSLSSIQSFSSNSEFKFPHTVTHATKRRCEKITNLESSEPPAKRIKYSDEVVKFDVDIIEPKPNVNQTIYHQGSRN